MLSYVPVGDKQDRLALSPDKILVIYKCITQKGLPPIFF